MLPHKNGLGSETAVYMYIYIYIYIHMCYTYIYMPYYTYMYLCSRPWALPPWVGFGLVYGGFRVSLGLVC